MGGILQTDVRGQSSTSVPVSDSTSARSISFDCPGDAAGSPLGNDLSRGIGSVLLVIPDLHERQQLAKTLTNLGCKVSVAGDSETALRMTRSRQPDLLVIDIGLPGRDGLQVCAEIRLGGTAQHTPIVLLSSQFGPEEKMRGLRLGAVGYITKPCDWMEVAAQVCSQLELERVRRDLALANFDLRAKQAQHEAELKAAAAVQKSLLPSLTTQKFEDVSVSWRFLPLDQVGGDLLGYTWLDPDHLAAYVVDVCGHGLPAAMMTAAISISLAPSVEAGDGVQVKRRVAFSPKEMLEKLDREYPIERFDRPFTISYLVLNRKTGEFRCSRAGHPMPIVIRREGQVESLEAGGTLIGLDRLLPFDEDIGKLNRGDSILLYTDGVTECTNASDTYGLERLSSVLRRSPGVSSEALCKNLMADLVRFNGGAEMHDDVTILALTYGESQESLE